jgi:hypothetical protein
MRRKIYLLLTLQKNTKMKEPPSELEPLTCSHYE